MTWPRTARRASAARREPEAAEDRAPGRAGTTLWIADAAIIELRTESRWRGTRGPGLRGVLRWAPRREARAGLRLAVSRRLRLRRDDAKVRTSVPRVLWSGRGATGASSVTLRRGRECYRGSSISFGLGSFPSLFDREISQCRDLWRKIQDFSSQSEGDLGRRDMRLSEQPRITPRHSRGTRLSETVRATTPDLNRPRDKHVRHGDHPAGRRPPRRPPRLRQEGLQG